MSQCTRFVRNTWKEFLRYGGHDSVSKPTLTITRATPGFVECSMKIEKGQTNRLGTLHGGIICSLIDTIGSLALTSQGLFLTGVSTDIHATFIRAAGGVGDEVRIEGRVLNMGKTLAYTETKIWHPTSGKLLAQGLHTKFVGKSLDNPKNVAFSESGDEVTKGEIVDSE